MRLEGKPALVLDSLLQRPGQLVSREELRQLLWPNGVHLDFDHGLNKCVNKLRAVLGDDPARPEYIETLSRVGYRFIAPVEAAVGPAEDVPIPNSEYREGHTSEEPDLTYVVSTRAEASREPERFSSVMRLLLILGVGTALALALAGLSLFGLKLNHSVIRPRTTRSVIANPQGWRLVTTGENAGPAALSPDGERVAFVAADDSGRSLLWMRDLKSLQAQQLENTEGAKFPFWSPDSQKLGFFADFKLKRLDLSGGAVQTICDAPEGRGGTWGPGDVILFAAEARGAILKVNAHGGALVAVTTLDEARFTTHRWPEFLPDGNRFIFLAANHNPDTQIHPAVFVGALDGSKARFLVEADSNAVYNSGRLLFVSGGKLIAEKMDPAAKSLDPTAAIIATDVEYDTGLWHSTFTASSDVLLYRARSEVHGEALVWYDDSGNRLKQMGKTGPFFELSLAPDNQSVAVRYGDPDQNIWVIHGDGTFTRLTEEPINYRPVWSPDGSRIAYGVHRGASTFGMYVKDTRGQGTERQLLTARYAMDATSWSSDGKYLLFLEDPGNASYQIYVYDFLKDRAEPYLTTTGSVASCYADAVFSPDGKWVAYVAVENGTPQVYLASFPIPNQRRRLTSAGGLVPRWRSDGRELYFLAKDGTLFATPITDRLHSNVEDTARPLFRVPAFIPGWTTSAYSVDNSGRKFIFVVSPAPLQSQFVLVTNWS